MQEDDKLRMMVEYVANSFSAHKWKTGNSIPLADKTVPN